MTLNAAFATFNFLAIFFVLLPSAWHWRARNVPTLLLIFWILSAVVPQAINSVIWYHHVDDVAPIWCDIVTKLRIGSDVGVAAAALCLMRQLESIAAGRPAHYTARDRRKQVYIDLAVGFGLPAFVMVGHVVVQGHRYDIQQRVGCIPSTYWSWPTLVLVTIWPPLVLIVAQIFGALAFRLFLVRRYQFAKLLATSKSAVTTSRFLRLLALASSQIAFSLPIQLVVLVFNVQRPFRPYHSWAYVHDDFNEVVKITMWQLNLAPARSRWTFELTFWVPIVISILFFVFFGLGEESLATYRSWASAVAHWPSHFKRRHNKSGSTTPQSSMRTMITLPPYRYATESGEISTSRLKEDRDDFELQDVREAGYGGVIITVEKNDFNSV
ncbi:a-factor receptor [Microbotryomycetes sp. JL221]|nr:a-factor receptor [Microbotryomycetes sp. JL221]